MFKWPWVSRLAYELLEKQVAQLQERNDRLIEAVSRPEANAPVLMPHPTVEIIEPASGWFDKKPFPQ